jgi:hypothetical protein
LSNLEILELAVFKTYILVFIAGKSLVAITFLENVNPFSGSPAR